MQEVGTHRVARISDTKEIYRAKSGQHYRVDAFIDKCPDSGEIEGVEISIYPCDTQGTVAAGVAAVARISGRQSEVTDESIIQAIDSM